MSNADKYDNIKVVKGTVRTLRHLSFEKDIPMARLVKLLADAELQRMGVKPR